MLKINKKTEYALMALKIMGEKTEDSIVTVREICDVLKTPFDTTAKVMQSMNHHGIVKSIQGLRGGYTLNKNLSEITFMEITKIAEDIREENFCQSNKGLCNLHSTCNIITPIDRLNSKIMTFLGQVSLKELFFENDHWVELESEASKPNLKQMLGIK
tara:strand:- start:75 stop:548 length:474 start_codon:yes stop_codon:yes gene_type:complete